MVYIATPIFLGVVALSLYYLFAKVSRERRLNRLGREHGCQPAQRIKESMLLFGLDYMVSNLKAFREHRLLERIQSNFETYGNTYSGFLLGNSFTYTIEPENLRAILALQFHDFDIGSKRHSALLPFLGRGIFTSDGAEWEHFRSMLRPNFARAQVANLNSFETHITHLLAHIPKDGSTVDLQELFFQLTLDSATDFLFGKSADSLLPEAEESSKDFAAALSRGLHGTIIRTRLGSLADIYRSRSFNKSCETVRAEVDKFVELALSFQYLEDHKEGTDSTISERYIFLRELAKETKNPEELRDQALNILVAGRDSTAGLLSFIFLVLARRNDVWTRLRLEVDLLRRRRPTYEDIKEMKYLRCVINEVLRLFPIVPFNVRLANKDTTLPVGGGDDGRSKILIPKNHIVAYSVWALHRRKDLFGADAEEFKPERWESRRHGWDYLPFNGGPRICLGQQFALTEASYTVIRLLQEFHSIENRDSRPWAEQLGLTLSSLNGTLVALKAV